MYVTRNRLPSKMAVNVQCTALHCTALNINRSPSKIHRSELILHHIKSIILQLPKYMNDASYITL